MSTWPTERMELEVLASTGWAFTDQVTPRKAKMATVPLLVVWMLHGVVPRPAFPKSNTTLPLALLITASQFCAARSRIGKPTNRLLPKQVKNL